MPFKPRIMPLTKGGKVTKHPTKGVNVGPQSLLRNSNPGNMTMNDYAKVTPMAMPQMPAGPASPELE